MRPIELTFSGLRSYRSTTSIDFTALDLFAVIGDTGAGKSTIIEALSLALYGTYTWRGGKIDELIADGATALVVELRFLADGDEWVVTRSRRRKNAPGINKLECRARGEKVDGNAAVNERVRALLGLTHDQFLRAVVMPQGRFDELLRATKAERTNILRSIFGLDDLRLLREKADALRSTWAPVRDGLSGKRTMLPDDPAADLAAARHRLEAADAVATQLAAARVDADRADEHSRRLADVHRRLRETLDVVPSGVDDPVAELRALAEHADGIAARRRSAEQDRNDALAAVAAVEAEQAALLVGFDRRDGAATAAERLRTAADRLAEAVVGLAAVEADMERLRATAPSSDVPVELRERATAAARDLEAAAQRLGMARSAADVAGRAWRDLVEAEAVLRRVDDAATAAEAAVTASRSRVADAEATAAEAERVLAAAKVAHSDAVRASWAAAAAGDCRVGDPCPVCRRDLPDGFVPPTSTAIDVTDAAVTAAEERATEHRAARVRAAAELERAEADLVSAHGSRASAAAECERRRGEATGLGVVVEAPDEATALAATATAVAEATAGLAEAERAAEAALQAVMRAEAALDLRAEQHRKDVSDATAKAAAARRTIGQQQETVAVVPETWRDGVASDPDAWRELAGRIDAACTRHAELDGQLEAARGRRGRAQELLTALQLEHATTVSAPVDRVLERVRVRHDRVCDVLRALDATADAFDGAPVGSVAPPVPEPGGDLATAIDAVSAVLTADDAVCADAAQRADDADRRLAAAKAELRRVLSEAGCDELTDLHGRAAAAVNERTNASTAVERAEAAAGQAAALDAALAVAVPFLADLEVLRTTLSDANFVNHLVGLREAELLAEATRRLKRITAGRYGFVPDFGIVNIASGEVRTPDSLSGGERFQAALALALALVEIASRGTGRLEAVFVDEGFGSLDAAALDVALDTLGSVAGGGKMVALISHLRPVAEYVDTVLHVRKDEAFGSTITVLTGEERDRFLDDEIRAGLTS